VPSHALRTPVPAVALPSAAPSLTVADRPVAARRTVLARLLALLTVLVAVAALGACSPPSSSTTGNRIASYARSHLGAPYVYGAAGPYVFDCSGLVQYSYRQAGIGIGRTSYDQAVEGRAISPSAAQPGDVIILGGGSHVGIYVGGGQMIDAPHTGASVMQRPIYAAYSVRRLY
jgi:cell wall-associated NlpC family hydrolase